MFIIWGSTHALKRNKQTREGKCQHCGKSGMISSYDATRFFTLYFIPLVPTGKYRIIDSCPKCKRCVQVPFKEYTKNKRTALAEIQPLMPSVAVHPEAALKVIDTLAAFGEIPVLYGLLTDTALGEMRNAGVQLALARVYQREGRSEHAQGHLALALQCEPNPDERCGIAAFCLSAMESPDDAWEILGPALAEPPVHSRDILIAFAHDFAARGMFEQSARILEVVATAFPEAAGDKHLEKLKADVAKRKRPKAIAAAKPAAAWRRRLIPAVIVIAILAGVVGGVLGSASQRRVFLVNGTAGRQVYHVNGERLELGGFTPREIRRPGREVTIDYTCPTAGGEKRTLRRELGGGFLSRLFDSKVHIFNPDRCAILYTERIRYSASSRNLPDHDPQYRFHAGGDHYALKGIDYAFRTPPSTIKIDSGSNAYKDHLALFQPGRDGDVWGISENLLSREKRVRHWVDRLAWEPGKPEVAQTMLALLGTGEVGADDIRSTVEGGLDHTPINIEWHRLYQELPGVGGTPQVVEEYRRRLADNPDSPALKYLYARLISDTGKDEAMRLFAEAESGPSPIGYGYYAMTYNYLVNGNLAKAGEAAADLARVESSNPQFHQHAATGLAAGKEWGCLAELANANLKKAPADLYWMNQRCYATLMQSGAAARTAWLTSHISKLATVEKMDPALVKQYRDILDVQLPVQQGSLDGYIAEARARSYPYADFCEAFAAAEPPKAVAYLEKIGDEAGLTQWLLAYSLAKACGDETAAAQAIAKALPALENAPGLDLKPCADRLKNGTADTEALAKIEVMPAQKAVLATAFGASSSDPGFRAHCLQLANDLAFEPETENLLVRRILQLAGFR